MDILIPSILMAVVLGIAMKVLDPRQKPGKTCQSCPEFKRCGGGRPRCPRRSENKRESTG